MPNEFIARNGIIAQNNSTVSGSLIITNGITGSLFGTSSFATNAINATSASFATNTTSASFATNAINATSASFATTASFALNSAGGGGAGFPFTGSAVITGSLTVIGTTTTTALVETSALRYKENISDLESADVIYQLRPVSFDWKSNHKSDIGFIAEEVNDLIPILAELNDDGEVEGVKYSKITTLLTKIVQNHQKEMSALKENITTLQQEIINLKNK
jgi:polyhydroxyalkanoate synthesis regulator phasin